MLRATQQLLFLSWPPHQTWGRRAKPKTIKFRPRPHNRPRPGTDQFAEATVCKAGHLVEAAHRWTGKGWRDTLEGRGLATP